MEAFVSLANGLSVAIQPMNLLFALIGVLLGTAVGGGFMIGTALLFATTSTAFGRRAFVTDFIIGAVMAVFIYVLFAKLLTLSLPAGPLERLF